MRTRREVLAATADRLSDSDRAKLMGGTLQRVCDCAPSKS